MAALDRQIYARYTDTPKDLRRKLRNWVRDRPEVMLALFPEWASLLAQLRQ